MSKNAPLTYENTIMNAVNARKVSPSILERRESDCVNVLNERNKRKTSWFRKLKNEHRKDERAGYKAKNDGDYGFEKR